MNDFLVISLPPYVYINTWSAVSRIILLWICHVSVSVLYLFPICFIDLEGETENLWALWHDCRNFLVSL